MTWEPTEHNGDFPAWTLHKNGKVAWPIVVLACYEGEQSFYLMNTSAGQVSKEEFYYALAHPEETYMLALL